MFDYYVDESGEWDPWQSRLDFRSRQCGNHKAIVPSYTQHLERFRASNDAPDTQGQLGEGVGGEGKTQQARKKVRTPLTASGSLKMREVDLLGKCGEHSEIYNCNQLCLE